ERAARELVAERAALAERHDDVGPARRSPRGEVRDEALGFAEQFVEPPLALEAGDERLVDAREDLDRDEPPVRGARAEDDRRAAAPADVLDDVAGKVGRARRGDGQGSRGARG